MEWFYPEEFNHILLKVNDCLEFNIKGEIVNPDEFELRLQSELDACVTQIDSFEALQKFQGYVSKPQTYIKLEGLKLNFNPQKKFSRLSLGRHWEVIPYKDIGYQKGEEKFREEYSRIAALIEPELQKSFLRFINKYLSGGVYSTLKSGLMGKSQEPAITAIAPQESEDSLPCLFSLNYPDNEPLNDLYDYLKSKASLISEDTPKVAFKAIFGLGSFKEKVEWTGSLALLNCFVRNLPDIFLPSNPNFPHFVAASNCFLYKGMELDSDQIRNNRYSQDNLQVQKLTTFLKDLSKYSS